MTGLLPRRGHPAAGSDVPGAGYDAFLSYSHRRDSRLASALQSSLHRYAKPWYRLRALRVFLDVASLSSPALWTSLEAALADSRWLILLASPEAALSAGVERELRYWRDHKDNGKLQIVVADGHVAWDAIANDFDWSTTTAVPRVLSGFFEEEPRFVDLRWARSADEPPLGQPRFLEAVADLAAPIHGRTRDEIAGTDVREHRRTQRLVRVVVSILSLLSVLAGASAVVALQQRDQARRERDVADSRFLASQAVDLRATDLPRGLLASIEALDVADTAEAREALLSTLQSNPRVQGFVHDVRGPVVYSPDGRSLAFQRDDRVQVWDLAQRRVVRTSSPLPRDRSIDPYLEALVYDPSGTRLLMATDEDHVLTWNLTAGDLLSLRIESPGDSLSRDVEPAADGRTVAVSDDGVVTLLDVVDLQESPVRLEGAVSWGGEMRFSPDGTRLAAGIGQEARPDDLTGGGHGRVGVWDLTTGRLLTDLRGQQARLDTLAWSLDGRLLAAADSDGIVNVWDVANGPEPRELRGHEETVLGLAFIADGTRLVSSSADRTAVLWDVASGTAVTRLEGHRDGVIDVLVQPLGSQIATRVGGMLVLWDLSAGADRRLSAELPTGLGPVADLHLHPNGRTLAVGSESGQVSLWDVPQRRLIDSVPIALGPRDFVDDQLRVRVAFSPDGRSLAASVLEGQLYLWRDWASGLKGTAMTGLAADAEGVSFSPDSRVLAAGLPEGRVGLFDVASGRPLEPLRDIPFEHGTGLPEFAPKGGQLAVYNDFEIRLWDADDRRRGETLPLPPSSTKHVAFDGSGGRIAAAVGNGTILVWDAKTRHLVAQPAEDARFESLSSMTLRPDGLLAASGYSDGLVRLWDLEAEQQFGADLDGHVGPVRTVAFSRDGTTLMTGADDGAVVMWQMGVHQLRERACSLAGRNLSDLEWRRLHGPAEPYRRTCPQWP